MRLRRQQKRIERSTEKHLKKNWHETDWHHSCRMRQDDIPIFCVANILHKNHNTTNFTTNYFLLSFFYDKFHGLLGLNASILKNARTL